MRTPKNLWESNWFRQTPAIAKLAFLYLLEFSGRAGVWDVDMEHLQKSIGTALDWNWMVNALNMIYPLEEETAVPNVTPAGPGRIWLARGCKARISEGIKKDQLDANSQIAKELYSCGMTPYLAIHMPEVRIVGDGSALELISALNNAKAKVATVIPVIEDVMASTEGTGILPPEEREAFFKFWKRVGWPLDIAWKELLKDWGHEWNQKQAYCESEDHAWPQFLHEKLEMKKECESEIRRLATLREVSDDGTLGPLKYPAEIARITKVVEILSREIKNYE